MRRSKPTNRQIKAGRIAPLARVLNASLAELYLLQNDRTVAVLHQTYARSLIAEKTKNEAMLQAIYADFLRNLNHESQFLARLISLRMANHERKHRPEIIKQLLNEARHHAEWWPELFDIVSQNYMLINNHENVRMYAKFALFHFERNLIDRRQLAAEYRLLIASRQIYRNFCYFEKFVGLYQLAKKRQDKRVMGLCLVQAAEILHEMNLTKRALRYANKAVRRLIESAFGEYEFFDALSLRCELLVILGRRREAFQDIGVLETCRFARISARTEELLGKANGLNKIESGGLQLRRPKVQFLISRNGALQPNNTSKSLQSKYEKANNTAEVYAINQALFTQLEAQLLDVLKFAPRNRNELGKILYGDAFGDRTAMIKVDRIVNRIREKAPELLQEASCSALKTFCSSFRRSWLSEKLFSAK